MRSASLAYPRPTGQAAPSPVGRGRAQRHPGILAAACIAASLFATAPAFAQQSPVGLWRSIDDKTGEAKAEIRIVDQGGLLSGRIERRLAKDAKPNALCEECRDERKGKPVDGMEIIRGAKKDDDEPVWRGGKILDPENGREYTLRLTPVDGGKRLDVRGSIGPFGRTQTWVRVQ